VPPLRLKLKVCLWHYLSLQLAGLCFAVLGLVAVLALRWDAFLLNERFREGMLIFLGFVLVAPGIVGLVAAIWKYTSIGIDERLARPPKD